MRPPTPNDSTHYACPSSEPCASSAATSPGRRVFPPDRLATNLRHALAEILARPQPGQTTPYLPPRHQTSQRHQVPPKAPRPHQHQAQIATRNPTHPPTKLTALPSKLGRFSASNSRYLCASV